MTLNLRNHYLIKNTKH